MSEYADLLYDVADGVATITLNRPDRMNAISGPMLLSFSRAFRDADRDPAVRVIILTGAGRGFCAGLDLKDLASGTGIGAGNGAGLGARFELNDSPPVVLHTTDKPVICALNGPAAGYGMDLALGCDIRIASTEAKLAAVFAKRGILPESGGTWLLPRLIGWAKAAEVAFLGKVLSAEESLALGLVNAVVEPGRLMDEARAWAAQIAANAPLAVQATKRMMRLGLEETFEANVHHVYLQLLPLFRTEDFREGVQAFLERREPRFQGR
ncbi:MAG TPA: enoyl-CoA hydratase-related protein [Dehalococcoidia bacterium]|jgi:enoyl-CoA hydratase/carnithine racemase|nr:enoyl-CoA hydratase-related protein [Dehalococcoidia bacterium]